MQAAFLHPAFARVAALFPNLDYQNSADLEVLRTKASSTTACANRCTKKAYGYIWLKDAAGVSTNTPTRR